MDDNSVPPDIFLVGLATLSLLAESANCKPVLLIADDVQWLDEATYDVLAFVSRRLSSDPIVLLAGLREGFDRRLGGADTLRHRVQPLGNADAELLLDVQAPGLSSDLRSRLLREASGNPLALMELPRAIQAAEDGEARWLPLTERLERAFSSRFSELPDATRTLLSVAAANDTASPHESMRPCEVLLGRNIGVDAFAPAVSARLIELNATELRCRHPLVRSAIYQVADLATRQRVHAALAAIIEDQDRRLRHRAAATIGPDDELAGEYDLMAARAQRRGSLALANRIPPNAAKLRSTAGGKKGPHFQGPRVLADPRGPQV